MPVNTTTSTPTDEQVLFKHGNRHISLCVERGSKLHHNNKTGWGWGVLYTNSELMATGEA